MSEKAPGYYEILRVSEQEMLDIKAGRSGFAKSYPSYYCIRQDGAIVTHPVFDPQQMLLFSFRSEKS